MGWWLERLGVEEEGARGGERGAEGERGAASRSH